MHGAFFLLPIFITWALASIVLGWVFLRSAPAVSIGLFGSVVGALVGFLIGNADGPAEAPAYTAVGTSIGLMLNGLIGILATSARPPAEFLRRSALLVLLAIPFTAAALTFLLQTACPLYVVGRGSGFCNYQGYDLLGGWVSGVIVAYVVDALFVVGLLLLSAWQASKAPSPQINSATSRTPP
jgi:hypothetical protein